MRKSLAAIVLIVLFGGIAAPATCSGWETSASDRMACCKRAQHVSCNEQNAADDCCAGQEQSQQPGSSIATALQAAPAPGVVLFTPAFESTAIEQTTATLFELSLAQRLHGPPGLLAPPLRI